MLGFLGIAVDFGNGSCGYALALEVLVDVGGKLVAHHVVDGNIQVMALFAEKLVGVGLSDG